jgi:hypothetical protein
VRGVFCSSICCVSVYYILIWIREALAYFALMKKRDALCSDFEILFFEIQHNLASPVTVNSDKYIFLFTI